MASAATHTLREIGKQDMESPTKADETMLLPLAQKIGNVFGRCASKQVRTELVEGLGNTYGFDMARKDSMEDSMAHTSLILTSHFKTSWV